MDEEQKQRYKDRIRWEWEWSIVERGNQTKRARGIISNYRTYKSVDWIQKILDSDITGKSIKARIKQNLSKKENLLDIKRCLITDAMKCHESERTMKAYGFGKVTMKSKVNKQWVDRDRIPMLIKLNVPWIARRLMVSDILIWKYLQSMEQFGFIVRPANVKKHNPILGAYRIIGGYVVHQRAEELKPPIVTPVYFWAQSQPEIQQRLAKFSL